MNKRKIWTLCTAILMIVVFICALSFTSSAEPIEPNGVRDLATTKADLLDLLDVGKTCPACDSGEVTGVDSNYIEEITEYASSCDAMFTVYWSCNNPVCGHYGAGQEDDVTIGHHYRKYDGEDPAYAPKEGEEGTYIKAATCTNDGERIRNCIYCAEVDARETLNKLGHTKLYAGVGEELGFPKPIDNALFEAINPATVTELGEFTDGYGFTWECTQVQTCVATFKATVKCDRCGEDIPFEGINRGHNFGPVGSGVEITPAKCFTPGEERVTCSACGYQETRTIPAIGYHNYEDDTFNVTLSTKCYEVWQAKCSVCDDVQTNYYDIHHNKVAVEAKAPSCLEDGNVEHWYCAVCEEYFKTADNATETDRYKDGASTEDGDTDSVCYDSVTMKFLRKTGHDFTDGHHDAVDPKCLENGVIEYYTCKKCEKNFASDDTTATIVLTDEDLVWAMTGHELINVPYKKATCLEDGNTAEYILCPVCGACFDVPEEFAGYKDLIKASSEKTKEYYFAEKTGHKFDWEKGHTVAVEPTCTVDGNVEYYTCKNCEKNFETNDTTAAAETALKTVVKSRTGHDFEYKEAEPVTCITPGYAERYRCKNTNHTGERFYAVTATTEAERDTEKESLKFSEDGKNSVYFKIKATGHQLVDVAPIAPTCLRGGNDEYQKCVVCNGCFDEVVPPVDNTWNKATKTVRDYALRALGHDFEEVPEVLAKCDADGNKKYYTCNTCELNFASNENTLDMSGVEGTDAWLLTKEDHIANRTTELLEEVAATCEEPGFKAGLRCADCKYIIVKQEDVAALEHDFGEYVYNNDATCTKNGTKTRSCTRLGCTKTEKIADDAHPATNHAGAVLHAAKAPTCTEDGNVAYYSCANCGKNFAATKNGDGTYSIGAELETVVDPKKGHVFTEYPEVAPTCQKAGNTAGKACKNCDYHEGYEKIPVDPTAHSYAQIATAKAATCVKEGSKDAWKCTVDGCGKYFVLGEGDAKVEAANNSWVIAIDPDKHVNVHYTQDAVPATCTETGLTGEWICRDCHKSQVQSVENALGHKTVKTEAKASTCSANGNKEYWFCTRCELYFATETGEGEEGAKNADAFKLPLDDEVHSFKDATYEFNKDATCVFNGTETAKCVWCKVKTQTRNAEGEDNLTDHTWVGVEKVNPTCTEEGTEAYIKCKVCGKFELGTAEDTKINALGHDFKDGLTKAEAATCVDDGNKAYWTCARCGKFFADKDGVADLEDELAAGKWVIEASAEYHDLKFNDAKAATCIATGNIAYWSCNTCNKLFADNNGEANLDSELKEIVTPIDSSNHLMNLYPEKYIDPDHVRVIANCVQDGCTDAYVCACGVKKTCEVEKAYGHIFKDVPEFTSCTELGYKEHVECAKCEKWFAAGTTEENGKYSTEYVSLKAYSLPATNHQGTAKRTPAEPCVMVAYWYCQKCEGYFTDNNGEIGVKTTKEALKADAHQVKSEETAAAEAGCLTDGVKFPYFHCDVCNKYFNATTLEEVEKDSWVIPSFGGHEYVTSTPKQAPTCTEDGWTEGYECSRCKDKVIPEVIPMTGHDTVVVNGKAPTCTEIGYDGFYVVCVNCGEVTARSEIVLKPLGHEMTKVDAVVPTCVKGGNKEYWTCTRCGLYFATKDGKDATTGEWLEGAKDATAFILTVDANAHKLTLTEAVKPTCTEGGAIAYNTCELCGKYFDLEGAELEEGKWEVKALGHDNVLQPGKAATCKEDGYTSYYKCTRCELVTGKETKPAAHTGVDFTADPIKGYYATDCKSTGLKSHYYCEDCETYFDGLTKAAVANFEALIIPEHHLYVEVIYELEEDAPTCTRSGKATTYCYACNKVVAESIDVVPEGHTMTTHVEAKAATCVATGNIEYWYCKKCEGYFTTEDGKENGLFVAALTLEDVTLAKNPDAHSVVTDEAVAAKCEETGLTEGSHCELCSKVFVAQEVIPALGHTEVIDEAVAPTCTEKGKTEGKHCSVCGKVLVYQTDVDATGHKYEWNETVPATCVTNGTREGVCAACGDTKTEEVKAEGHLLKDVEGKESTCSVAGYEAYVECATCTRKFVEGTTDVFSTEYIKAPAAKELAAHDFKEWVADYENKKYTRACKACGFVEEKAMDVEDYSAELKLTVDNAIVPGATLVDSTTAKVTVSLETAGAYLNNISFKFTYDAEKFAFLGYKIVNANINVGSSLVNGKDGVVTAFLTAAGLEDVMFSGEALVEVYFTVICDEKADDVEFNFVEGSYKLLNEEFKTIETEVKNAECDIALFLDVNNDGAVDGADLAMTKAMAENDEYNAAVDINKDGKIDVDDYMDLLGYYVGMYTYEELISLGATADED